MRIRGPGTCRGAPWPGPAGRRAGDTVTIRSGTYAELLVPENSGTDGSFITFTAAPGDTVTIEGAGVTIPYDRPGRAGRDQREELHQISGLRVINSTSAGIFAWNERSHRHRKQRDLQHVLIGHRRLGVQQRHRQRKQRRAGVQRRQPGVHLDLRDGHLRGQLQQRPRRRPRFERGEGIDAKEACVNGRIFGNSVHDLSRLGIYVDAWDSSNHDIEVYDNSSFRNDSGFAVSSENGGQLERIRVHDNVAYDNRGVGFLGRRVGR